MTARIAERKPARRSRRRATQVSVAKSDVHGWITHERPFHDADEHNHLARHADWSGPTKLVWCQNACRRVSQLFVPESFRQSTEVCPEEIDQQLFDLIRLAADAAESPSVKDWEPPGMESITRWLEDAGYTGSMDEQQRLRLSLVRRGRDGQVRFVHEPGTLRLEMHLGSWQSLDHIAEKAMYQLAVRANAGVHLARIAWRKQAAQVRCEAQVDLSGLPVDGFGLLPTMLPVAVTAMQVTLSQLGLELETLATAGDSRMAEELLATFKQGSRRGRKTK